MTTINNFLNNDYIFFPLWIGVVGALGYGWWSESTRVFSLVNNETISPVSSWPYDWTVNRVTESNISPRSFNFSQQQLARIQENTEWEVKMGNALSDIQNSTQSIVAKLNDLKQLKELSNVTDRAIQTTPNLLANVTDQAVQTDPNLLVNVVNNFHYYHADKGQQMIDFLGLYATGIT